MKIKKQSAGQSSANSKRYDSLSEYPIHVRKDNKSYHRLQLTRGGVWYTRYNDRDEITGFIIIDRSSGTQEVFETCGSYAGAYEQAEAALGRLGGV